MIRIDTALIGQEQKQHAGVPPAPTSADQLAAPQLHAYPCHTRPETGSNLPRRFSAFFRLRATSSPLELELEVKLELELETQFRSVDAALFFHPPCLEYVCLRHSFKLIMVLQATIDDSALLSIAPTYPVGTP